MTGVDVSSPATLAAYFNSLSYLVEQSALGKTAVYQLRSGTFCSWNAFAKVDVRVEAKIPGGVDSYAVDPLGQK